MAARNRGPPLPAKGGPHGGLPQPPVHEPPFARGLRGVQLHPHPVIIEERLAAQHDDIQVLLVDNQRLAATHVALRQELEAAQYELQRADKFAHTMHAEKDLEMRELYEKSIKMENELHTVNAMRSELMQVHMDIKELTAARQDLTTQVQMMTQDLGRVTSDLQQVPAVKAEIEGLKHELERARAAIEHEKKGFAESFDHVAAVGNPGVSYNANYGNPEQGYPGNPYSVGYGMTPTNSMHPAPTGAEGYPQYGPGPGAWGSYDAQRAQGPR
ncbi:hypothetical protein DH2020_033757 [Rehmannia glutinosa]|uniref:Protein FLX-like 1 n=1 Tax=Rehmannia glutinosa TaxID=99300 RepID=A0ABR0VC47_REHGL